MKKFLKKESFKSDEEVQSIVKDIKENSFSVVPDFFTEDECNE